MLRRALFAAAIAFACAAPAAAQPSSSAPAQDDDRGSLRALTSAESYLPMPAFSAGVIGRATTSGTLVVDVGLDVPDAALRGRANAMGPRVRDALRTALSAYANTFYRHNTAPDPVQLTRMMQTAVDRTLGRPGARVLMANIVYQSRR